LVKFGEKASAKWRDAALSDTREHQSTTQEAARKNIWEHAWLLPLLIFLLGASLRFYRLGAIPGGLNGDELFNAIDALRIGGGNWPVFFAGNNGRESLFLYLMAASLRLLGQNIFAMRLPAALLGSALVPLTYLLGRDLFNRRVGLVGAALVAVSLWPVMESRWALRAVSLTFFTALTLYFAQRAFARKQARDWLWSGLFLGLTLYTYIPARIFPLVILGWLGWLFFTRREELRPQWRAIGASWLIGIAVFAPFARYIWLYPEKVNQRIGTLNVGLDAALAERSLTPLLPSIWGVLRMFSFTGDKEWRYHLSGQPVFDPVTSLFFYLGLGIAVWLAFSMKRSAGRSHAYALLLLWAGAMLGPNAILEANSSFLRAAGAIVPIYLLTALGFDWSAAWVQKRWGRVRPATVAVFVAAGILLLTVRTSYDYFVIWNNQEDVRRIYQVDLGSIGRYLEDNTAPADTRVFIGEEYVLDLAPQTLAYHTEQPVDWFHAASSFALGNPQDTGEYWYLLPVNDRFGAEVTAVLDLPQYATPITFSNGDTAFTLYRLPAAATAWSPQYELIADYRDGPQLIGYDLPDELTRGETIPLLLHWRIPPDRAGLPNFPLYIQAQLLDGQGNLWQQESSLLGYPQDSWREGDRFIQVLSLEIPDGIPAGSVTFRVNIHDAEGTLVEMTGANETTAVAVRSQLRTDYTPGPDTLVFADTVALDGALYSSLIAPGLGVDIALDWIALQPPPADYAVQFSLHLPGEGEPFLTQTSPIWPDVYPPSSWQAGEQVRSLHRLQIPLDIPTAANPLLRVQLVAPSGAALPVTGGDTLLGELTLDLRERMYEIPPIAQPLAAQIGEDIRLLGYDLDVADGRAGSELRLTLYWQAIATPPDSYTVFNQLIGADGQIYGQFDSPPQGAAWLTATWLPGEVVVEERLIPIWADAPAGSYQLAVGLYSAADGVRLPVTVDGVSQPGDQLIVTDVTVEP
jgi:4-amino-4-deoxy-L-arabinose transferase-like glycosyltransferase